MTSPPRARREERPAAGPNGTADGAAEQAVSQGAAAYRAAECQVAMGDTVILMKKDGNGSMILPGPETAVFSC
jgi:hypothetical protein